MKTTVIASGDFIIILNTKLLRVTIKGMKILDETAMRDIGARIGRRLRGGEVIELIGDVGTGKTTFVKGLAAGLDVTDDVQSPSFTINRSYAARGGLTLSHYDFYRLADAGIMAMEIAESLAASHNVTVIEWGESVRDVLPAARVVAHLNYLPDAGREVKFTVPAQLVYLTKDLDDDFGA
jgi:tRNA threonylcarbamoyladenosine biosynthesis protein TsaE